MKFSSISPTNVPPTILPAMTPRLTTRTTLSTPKITSTKAEKGLRHFSARVCAKVEEKGSTSYNEVADELVQEMSAELGVGVSLNLVLWWFYLVV